MFRPIKPKLRLGVNDSLGLFSCADATSPPGAAFHAPEENLLADLYHP
jgi:hypothetical protein